MNVIVIVKRGPKTAGSFPKGAALMTALFGAAPAKLRAIRRKSAGLMWALDVRSPS